MHIEHADNHALTPEEQAHLDKLRTLVQEVLADGSLSEEDLQRLRAFVNADGQVTAAELDTIRSTIRDLLGDASLEFDWS